VLKPSGKTATGEALNFDGGNDYVVANSTSSFFGATPTTIAFWCKPSQSNVFILDLGFTCQVSTSVGGNRLDLSGFFLGGADSGATVD
jgi:hypothetical protein